MVDGLAIVAAINEYTKQEKRRRVQAMDWIVELLLERRALLARIEALEADRRRETARV